MLFSVILFFILTWAFGFSITYFVKKPDNVLEYHLMNLGIGLGTVPILGTFLNLIHVPLDWRLFLLLSLILPLYSLYKSFKNDKNFLKFKFKPKIKKSTVYIIFAIILTVIFLVIYHKGAFAYPYLEDDDPWGHVVSTSYIAKFKTFSIEDPSFDPSGYFEAYPQGYGILQGLMKQTNNNIIWSLKFFNVLIISLGLLFFFFFSKEFLKSHKKALFATFVIFVIPCFLSHFIWASTLAITLFFPALYCVERIKSDKRWVYPSIIIIASIIVTQPSNGLIFSVLFFIYWNFSVKC